MRDVDIVYRYVIFFDKMTVFEFRVSIRSNHIYFMSLLD